MGSLAEQLEANVLPPRRSKGMGIAVTSTAQVYDLRLLAFGDTAPSSPDSPQSREVVLTLCADGCKVYFHFRPDSGADLSDTPNVTAGGTAALANSAGLPLYDGEKAGVHINRTVDKYIVVKAPSGTSGTLWIAPTSQEVGA